MKFTIAIKSILFLWVCFVSQAMAANYEYCGNIPLKWSGSSYTMYAAPVSFPTNGTMWPSLQKAVQRISANPSNFYINLAQGSNSTGFDNGRSEIWFTPDSASTTTAIAYNWRVCTASYAYIYEVDVMFYSGVSYTGSMNKSLLWGYGGTNRPLQTTAIHELGHTAGLMHVSSEYNIMGTDYYHIHANGDLAYSYLGEDAAFGLEYLYGRRSSAYEDLSLAHWKRIGSSGQYSSHGHTELFSSSGALLASTNDTACSKGCEKRYQVTAGTTVQFELTEENSGRSTLTPNIAYYISTNNEITTADTLIATDSFSSGRGNVTTFKKTLTIPANLATGNYWLGAIVNYDNAISEDRMDNNAMSTPIYVTGGGSSSGGSSSGGSSSGGSSSGGSSSGGSSSGGNQLQNGVPVTGLSASTGNSVVYTINVPSGASNLVISISGGSGDADLYTRLGSAPTDSSYVCRPYASGNNETCTEASPSAGVWYARLKAYSTFSGVTLTASYSGGGSSSGGSSSGGSSSGGSSSGGSSSGGSSSGGSSSGGSSSGGSSGGGITDACATQSPVDYVSLSNGAARCVTSSSGGQLYFYFYNNGYSSATLRTQHGSGDATLYYSNTGSWPTSSSYTLRSNNAGNTETIAITSLASGWNLIMINGAHSGMTLQMDAQ